MTLVDIPRRTILAHERVSKNLKRDGACYAPWWRVNELPAKAILAKSTGRGQIREGVLVYLIGGHNRDVFPAPAHEKISIHEYVGLVDGTGWQPLVQLGRDVEML